MVKNFFEKNSVYIVATLLAIFFLGLALVCVYASTGPWFYDDAHIAYVVKTEQRTALVEEVQVQKELGKEPVYLVAFKGSSLEVKLDEETYQTYIGEQYNAITYEYAEVTLYVADGFFGTNFKETKLYSVYRLGFPWEGSVEFSDAEIQEFKEKLCSARKKFKFSDLSFEVYGHRHGSRFGTSVLESGAVRWAERDDATKVENTENN